MSTNLAHTQPEACAAPDGMTPQPITSRDAWNTPIFTIPAEPEREPVLAPEREPVLESELEPEPLLEHESVPVRQPRGTHCVVERREPSGLAKRIPNEMPGEMPGGSRRSTNNHAANGAKVSAVIREPEPQPEPQPEPMAVHEPERAGSADEPRGSNVETVAPPAETRAAEFTRGETSEVWGLQLDRVDMNEAVQAIDEIITERTPRYIITANLNYAMLLDRDASLQAVTDDAALVLADGQPLVWRSRIGSAGRLPERVAGSELIYRIAERAAANGWRIYFLGAEAGVAQRCADTLAECYPGLQVAGVQSPPYRTLGEHEQQQLRQGVIDSRADILLVAFGQPKGERWIHQHYQELGVPLSIQVGASFDFVAGTAKRAPLIWQRLGLEWCHRMLSDPARLVPRYGGNAWFMFLSLIRDWRDYVDDRFGESAAAETRT